MNALLELAERCEAATGPDLDAPNRRALADEIGRAVGATFAYGHAPDYLASLDLAMTLVPDGHTWALSVGGNAIAQVTDGTGDACAEPRDYDGHAATPALALCAAILRARAQKGSA